MTLLAVERIKLLTTRSPWWGALTALVLTTGFTALIVANSGDLPVTIATTQFGYFFGLAVVMVLAALAVTTEYRFSTIRTTFQAIPNRTAALLAKATVVGGLGLIIGELVAFASWGLSMLIQPGADLALNSSADWINVAGVGAIYALASVIAVSVGFLVRHSAGAVALLMIYVLAVEDLIRMIPSIGDDIHQWLPFNVANKFLTGDGASNAGRAADAGAPLSTASLGQGASLAYFAAFAVAMLAIAIFTARRRDA